jgi:hypothetical protein
VVETVYLYGKFVVLQKKRVSSENTQGNRNRVADRLIVFKVVKTGKKTAKKGWKRMITKATFVGPDFTRRPVKSGRFITPMRLRYKKVNRSLFSAIPRST